MILINNEEDKLRTQGNPTKLQSFHRGTNPGPGTGGEGFSKEAKTHKHKHSEE